MPAMCSRFEMNLTPRELGTALALTHLAEFPNRAEVRPTDSALVIRPAGETRMLRLGFTVEWSKSPMINARAESLDQKPTFRPHLENRCLVPASAYFEWRSDDRGRKLKNRIFDPDGMAMTFAGLIDGESFTIVTCAPAPRIAHVHDRMPVILGTEARRRWLDPALHFADVKPLLVPYAGPLKADEDAPPPPKQADLFG